MRKSLIAILSVFLLLMTCNLFAQSNEDTIINTKVIFGLNLGFSNFNQTINYSTGDHSSSIKSFNLGLFANFKLNKNLRIRLGLNNTLPVENIFQVQQNGKIMDSKTKITNQSPNETLNYISPFYLQMPLHLIYDFSKAKLLPNYVFIGYAPSYNIYNTNSKVAIQKNNFDHVLEMGMGYRFKLKYVYIIPEFKFGFGSNIYQSNASKDIQLNRIRNNFSSFTVYFENTELRRKRVLNMNLKKPLHKRPDFLLTILTLTSVLLLSSK